MTENQQLEIFEKAKINALANRSASFTNMTYAKMIKDTIRQIKRSGAN